MEDCGGHRDPARKLVFLETFGCQMNDNDSSRMLSILDGISYSRTDEPERADLIIINTCSVRDKAEHKVHSA
ncbi:MAG: tRNA (N6-isopentenyl adenosine(37)-C2)-methylthiotransferase MiaB, partial [Deltaproteobacteria bacterium]